MSADEKSPPPKAPSMPAFSRKWPAICADSTKVPNTACDGSTAAPPPKPIPCARAGPAPSRTSSAPASALRTLEIPLELKAVLEEREIGDELRRADGLDLGDDRR